jgi:hypothetical protein
MVSMLLLDLPNDRPYKVVFMRREMREVLASQRKMLERLGEQEPMTEEEAVREDRIMASNYRTHLVKVHNAVAKLPNIEILYVRYNDALSDPTSVVNAVNEFYNGELDVEAMSTVVDPSLYRNRG